ncbi:ABC transporter ATP-binding protein [Octadecabacter sp. CECT 8868]|uniref:ABC transporter ATP-binding protein n=1 Tax=Octadecabacter algicola TaxID=2909342 RepID=UPI001F3E2370|nr:ABC transporter ATP-binding protein [Octadecabacter algicola]MCF2905064.1 ABC transporter ATP-binding protein [Octadecabacter algicola]
MAKSFLSIERLTQKYPDGNGGQFTVFENASFGIEKGEFVCILGHSGCGKSTIMNILAGLSEPTSGVVKMDGFQISGPSLDRGVVFQNYSLLPWLSALKNVTFGVAARFPDWTKQQVEDHSIAFLAKVGLSEDAIHRKPSQLSGGMRQRVSIARAFANEPKLLLLDEPFGALDALTRGTIQEELLKVWRGTNQTVFMITHDIDEAILLADRILLMTNGPLARVAESVEITIPRPRVRTEIVESPNYYAIRNHLVQFLGKRSAELAGQPSEAGGTHTPQTIRIDKTSVQTSDQPILQAVKT